MQKTRDPIDRLRIAAPCPTSWEGMAGDERVRHCTLCNLNVYNFAEMTRDEVQRLLMRSEGRVCARLYQRADGTILTRDCPTGLRALRRRASRIAAALFATLLMLPSLAFGKPRFRFHGSQVKLQIERVATPQAAMFNGVVREPDGNPLPGVTIAVRNETSKREITTYTDENGAFKIAALNDGLYRVDVTLPAFKTVTMKRLQLKASEVTHANVTLRLDPEQMIILGELITEPAMGKNGFSTTFTRDFINKMP